MRLEKLNFDREIGQVEDKSWISVSETDQGYELAVRTNLIGDEKYTEWNTADIEDPEYARDESDNSINSYSSTDGFRTLNPGTSREIQSPFSLSEEVHGGLLGEVQAVLVYDQVEEYIDDGVGLYDFVEWFQDEPKSDLSSMMGLGPEFCFALDDSGVKSSLDDYMSAHAFDGTTLQTGLDGDTVAEIPDTRDKSILRQTGLQAVEGILTQNPKEVREMVDEK